MASPAITVRAGAGLRMLRAAVFTAVCVVLAAAGHSLADGRPVPGVSLVLAWLAVFAVVAPLAGRERSLRGIAALMALGQIVLHAVFSIGRTCVPATAAHAWGGGAGSHGLAPDGGLAGLAARLACGPHGQRLAPAAARALVSRAGLGTAGLGPAHLADPAAHAAGTGGHQPWPGWMDGMPGMSGPPAPAGTGGGLTGGVHSLLAGLPFCSLPMLLGHLLAAVLAGWLLRRGEAALWRLIRLSLRVRGAASLSPAAALRRAHALLSVLANRSPYSPPRGRTGTDGTPGRHRTVWLRHSVARRGPPVFAPAA